MFKKFKIKTLISGSVGVLILGILIMGITSIYYVKAISNQTSTLYNKPHTNLISMLNLKVEYLQAGALVSESVISKGEISSELREKYDKVLDSIDIIEKNKISKDGPSAEMQAIISATNSWGNCLDRLIDFVDNKKYDDALVLLNQEYHTLQNDVVSRVDGIIKTASENAKKFKDNSDSMAVEVNIILYIIFIIVLIISIFSLIFILNSIQKPMKAIQEISQQVANGKLKSVINYSSNNEFGDIANNIRNITNIMNKYINNISYVLGKISENDLTVSVDIDYIGDFLPIKKSMTFITEYLRTTLAEIENSSRYVSDASNNVSSSSQMLAQGAEEQASSVEELASTIYGISEQIKLSVENAKKASSKTKEAEIEVQECSNKMEQLNKAIGIINDKANDIGKIIKTIEDIAFQTNILSLNAAVEASRAGEAGKSFSVVAEEVRNLAVKSGEAAQNTTLLIEDSIQAIYNGTKIAKNAADSLDTVVSSTEQIFSLVNDISSLATSQEISIEQVSEGINQISSVVQTNSATAEQSAAASEELSSQSENLKDLVNKFKVE